jgi:hypothetical protein
MVQPTLSKKDTHINRNKLNELKENLSQEDSQIMNILSKNIFPKSTPKVNILVENILALDEKSKKKNRFSFKVTKEIRNSMLMRYLDVFPQSFQEDFKKKHSALLE